MAAREQRRINIADSQGDDRSRAQSLSTGSYSVTFYLSRPRDDVQPRKRDREIQRERLTERSSV
jgi:hypothetical protein